MLTESEYAALIQEFMVELNHLWIHEDPGPLQALPSFDQINSEYLSDLRDPAREPVHTLRTAFAFIDEFVAADRARIRKAAYAAYASRSSTRPTFSPPSA